MSRVIGSVSTNDNNSFIGISGLRLMVGVCGCAGCVPILLCLYNLYCDGAISEPSCWEPLSFWSERYRGGGYVRHLPDSEEVVTHNNTFIATLLYIFISLSPPSLAYKCSVWHWLHLSAFAAPCSLYLPYLLHCSAHHSLLSPEMKIRYFSFFHPRQRSIIIRLHTLCYFTFPCNIHSHF